ncbi:PREDICTED: uncharacterized protein LOC105364633 [Ceratosolen solmsi marchali]|uniref:Uncharacterized protein LOC105364633 n=1 Tax=Ceratosolen solmsi marchali TaxID=326594 RepID=A0AAJ6YMP4_9HYME|nr:PREDICTED: uncharacterized protein LOC105364633 [Ceratosolen solmsi marchali]
MRCIDAAMRRNAARNELLNNMSKNTTGSPSSDLKNEKPLSSKDLHLWTAWLIKVVETAEYEWEDWLFTYIDFITRLNEYLKKAKLEIETKADCPPNRQRQENVAEGICCEYKCDTDTIDNRDNSKKINEDNDEEDKIIPLPLSICGMETVVMNFNREAEKYEILYEDWKRIAEQIIKDITGKTLASGEQEDSSDETSFFPYLKEETCIDIGIELDMDVLDSCAPEKITCDNCNLFFNIKD